MFFFFTGFSERRNSVTNYVNGVHFLKVFNLLRHRSYHLRKTARRKTILWRREKIRSKRQIFLSKDRGKTMRRRGTRKSRVFLRKKMGIKKGSHAASYRSRQRYNISGRNANRRLQIFAFHLDLLRFYSLCTPEIGYFAYYTLFARHKFYIYS